MEKGIVQIRELKKTFRTGERMTEALRGVDLIAAQGEFLAVMGASGSGKSTLLHLIAGLTSPDSGEILVGGIDIFNQNDTGRTAFRRHKVGLIFQYFNLISTLNVEDNIMLPLLADSKAEAKKAASRMAMLIERLGLEKLRTAFPASLSGGEQQRVAIARALIADPDVILADEPTGSLDSVNGAVVCQLLRDIGREQHKTVIVVTHEPAVAKWADRVVILKDGMAVSDFRVDQFPDAESLAAHYQDVVKG